MAKVYISGAITDNPNYKEEFAKAEELLKMLGHEVVNPTRISGAVEYFDYADFMITSLMLLKKCDTIYFLPSWTKSDGSKIEKKVAQKLGMKIIHGGYLAIANPNRRRSSKGQHTILDSAIRDNIETEINIKEQNNEI